MNEKMRHFIKFRGSKRGIEVLTGNLMMLMVMMAVFSSIAYIVRSSSDKYSKAQEEEIIDGIAVYLRSMASDAWGVGADEISLDLPKLIGSKDYIIESDPGGKYLWIRTDKKTYRIINGGLAMSRRSISSSQPHTIGIREGRTIIDPHPLTELLEPLDGSIFSGSFNVSYRTSASATQHSIYLDEVEVASSPSSLDGFIVDPGMPPTNLTNGQHILTVATSNEFGEGSDSVRFVVDRVPPRVDLNMTQIMTNELNLEITDITTTFDEVEIYIFVTDDKDLPVRELDADNFYMYNSAAELVEGGRFSISVIANDSESRVDPRSYIISRQYQGDTTIFRSKDANWDSKEYNTSTMFWGVASDLAGNTQTSSNLSKNPINRIVEIGSPDRKSDLSIIFTNDVSGSMQWVMWKDEYPKPGEESRLDYMKSAVKSFIDKMFPEDEAAICSFTTNYATGLTEIILQEDFTPTTEDGKNQLKSAVEGLSTRDGTPLYDALYESVLWAKERTKYRAVLVLTDGKDLNYATGEPYSTRTSGEVIDLARAEGIPIYCVGLGEADKVDVNILNAISDQTNGRFYLAPTPEKLQEAYDQIAGELLSGYKLTYSPGYMITGGQEVALAVYDDEDRSGTLDIILPVPDYDNWPPTVTLISPDGGEVASGIHQIQWTATDPEGDPLNFDLYYSDDSGAGWTQIDSGLNGPGPGYTYNWDTTTVFDGNQYMIRVVASDGNWTRRDSSSGVFEVDNIPPDGIDPTVTINNPTYPPSKKVKNTYTLEGDASDTGGSGLNRVEIWIDGVHVGDATLLPGDSWSYDYDTTSHANGVVPVEARAYDGEGNSATHAIQMEIKN